MRIKTFLKAIAAAGFGLSLFAAQNAPAQSPPFSSYSIATLGGNCVNASAMPYQGASGITACTPAGINGQALSLVGGVPQWTSLAGAGSVTSVGLSMPSIFGVTGSPITASGTLTATLNSQAANLHLASPDGSAGVPSFRALALGDLPTITVAKGGTNATTASGTSLDNITGFSGTGLMRRAGAGTYTFGSTISVAEGGTNATSASGTALDNISGMASTGIIRRTGAGTYTQGTTVSVAEGGTGATSASGTSLDNISGMASTGIIRRTGAGTYTQGTQVATGEIADGSITTIKLATPAASGASKVLLGTATASGVGFADINGLMTSTYDSYELVGQGIQTSTSTCDINLRVGTSGTPKTSANYFVGLQAASSIAGSGQYNSESDTGISLATGIASFNPGVNLYVSIPSPSSTTIKKVMTFTSNYYTTAAHIVWRQGGGAWMLDNTALTDLRVYSPTCIINGGTLYLYGIRTN